jgi:hypothetical protein
MEFVQSNEKDLRWWVTWHPILKAANCQEILISMGVHVLRHVKQIDEIKSELTARQFRSSPISAKEQGESSHPDALAIDLTPKSR